MDFRGAVVDAKRPDIPVNSLDDGIAGDSHTAQDLQRAIDDAAQRLRAEHLVHAGLVARLLALTEHPGRLPDGEQEEIDLDLIVGEHEADALMLADRTAERLAMASVFERDRLGAWPAAR